jgi:hypothetical protein
VTILPDVDIEQLAVVWLTERLPGVAVSNDVPSGPGVRLIRSPGSNDGEQLLPRVDAECFAPDRVRMQILAGKVHYAFAELAGETVTLDVSDPDDPDDHTTLDVRVDDVNTVTDPVPAFWSPTVQRSVAVYEFDVRTDF